MAPPRVLHGDLAKLWGVVVDVVVRVVLGRVVAAVARRCGLVAEVADEIAVGERGWRHGVVGDAAGLGV